MAGLESIISQIQKESEEAAGRTIAEAEEKAAGILEEARQRAAKDCDEIRQRSEREVKDILERGRSAADLKLRRDLLDKKQQIISGVLAEALSTLKNLEPEAYFDAIVRLAAGVAMEGEGTLYFSEADRKRMPADLEERLNEAVKKQQGEKARLRIAQEARPIEGGFVLCYDGIEENCSFDAMFDFDQERLQDVAGGILFA
ncbi:MAG TPA: V-type ATP synthase subunit E [Candidatus Eisenbergiella merdavium]|uniref:V-type ATP synthase subunit E n=1 Tax=Candidatus Eisenbergiella merdavium TaxID=2838551 RepID=A0A9D2SPL1_9FIRM|nr:V-type ATP synthase subunit E [Candidatus Eisenbergiella merdavium]